MTSPRHDRLRTLYDAFNERDIDTVLAAMTTDVDWPNGWEGGRLTGHDRVRDYWERQWRELRVGLTPTRVLDRPDGRVEVRVRMVVRDPSGSVLARTDVRHVYELEGDLVRRMDVETG